jgi:hypothetical protein
MKHYGVIALVSLVTLAVVFRVSAVRSVVIGQ